MRRISGLSAGRLIGLSLQSKLLVMLMVVSFASTLAVGAIGYVSGTNSLRDAAYDRLTSLRAGRALAVESLLQSISDDIVLASKGETTVDATHRFTADFERYQPSYNVPTGWAVTAVGDNDSIIGALAVQFPVKAVDQVMTVDQQWENRGLGETGESYIVGQDHLMRSVAREAIEDPTGYETDAVAAGTDPDTAALIRQYQGTVLLQQVNTPSVDAALKGKTGTDIEMNYLGREVLSAYAPLHIEGADWVVVASIDTAEAFAPVADFSRHMVLTISGILLAVAVLSLLLAQVFTRPVRGLVSAVRRVSGGELGVEVPVRSRDEFGDLASAFNDMSRTLQIKQDLIDEQRVENDKLLRNLMPDAVAQRYKQGEEIITQSHEEVSVVFAELVGFDQFAAPLSPEAELTYLNELVRGFDDVAERTGVENMRTLRDGYLATCGLVVPRVDNVRRIVEFTQAMQSVVGRFNATTGAGLQLRAGIDSGPVTSGVVGRATIAYDMWGEAVSLARRAQYAGGRPGIFVTDRVKQALFDSVAIVQVETQTDAEPVWEIVQE